MFRLTILYCLLISFPGISHSVPIITGTVGVTVDGGTLTVNGTGFGDQGPTIRIYDNFEGGTVGEDVDLNAVVGSAWFGYGSNKPIFDDVSYPGDPPVLVSDSAKISRGLNWRPEYTNIDAIILTALDFRKAHTCGY